jgi:polysaccharide biosynthesis/export protein
MQSESGTVCLTHAGRARLFALACVLAATSGVRAQQAPQPQPSAIQPVPQEAATPAPAPAALPVSQAATPASGMKSAPQYIAPNIASLNNTAANTGINASTEESALLKLGAGDLLEVSVYNVPELSSKARVGTSGDVYLPLVDYVHVGDLTVEEAQSLIAKRLEDGGFVRSPHVTIFVDESASQGVTVLGEVSKPGIYPDLGDHKLYEIISEAGGFTITAARRVSIIRRTVPEPIQVTLPRNLGDDLTNNVDVLPGDTLVVPRAPIIYVVGDVGRPSGLLIDNGTLTVLQAIALAGGTNRTAKLGAVRIIHKTPTGMTEAQVPLKKMLEAKAPDITLQADDILFVPVSGGKVFAQRSFEAAMSAATAVSIYAVHP